ncbi:HD domain-containing protein [Patescibacteria group bacterium]|nr:HD domain-containing protein [Patescibacteria group bacterium]
MKANIKILNKANIASGKIKSLIPEFYELKNVIENTDDSWHDQESVFDHTQSVISSLEKLFSKARGNLKKILNQKIDKNTRKILLKVSAVFHDIAKKETIVKDKQGFTVCPGHAEAGAEKAKRILNRFDLSEREKRFILDIIGGHIHFHLLLSLENYGNFQRDFPIIKNRYLNSVYPELILLDYADTVNAGIRKTQPKEYRYRMDFYKREIEKLS